MSLNPNPKTPMERVEEMADDMLTTFCLRPRPGADMEAWHAWLAEMRRSPVRMNPNMRQSNTDEHLESREQPPGGTQSCGERAGALQRSLSSNPGADDVC